MYNTLCQCKKRTTANTEDYEYTKLLPTLSDMSTSTATTSYDSNEQATDDSSSATLVATSNTTPSLGSVD